MENEHELNWDKSTISSIDDGSDDTVIITIEVPCKNCNDTLYESIDLDANSLSGYYKCLGSDRE